MTNTRLKKIALFGGSFNPIHNQHINLIKKLSISNVVDEIWIIPCKKHAFAKHFAPVKDRLNMIKLGIKDIPKTKICKIELNSKITNYTINTIKKLKTRYPKNEFFWVIGSDILYEITKWNNYQELLNETQFIVFIRKGYAIKKVNGLSIYKICNCKENNISSTKIRKNIKEKKSIKDLVPLDIEEYIKKRKLYK